MPNLPVKEFANINLLKTKAPMKYRIMGKFIKAPLLHFHFRLLVFVLHLEIMSWSIDYGKFDYFNFMIRLGKWNYQLNLYENEGLTTP